MKFFSFTAMMVFAANVAVADTAYFSGSYHCESDGHLNLRIDGGGADRDVTMWYRNLSRNRFEGLSGNIPWDSGGVLQSRRVGLSLSEVGKGLNAVWLNRKGEASSDCEPFTLHPAEAPLDRVQGVIDLGRSEELSPEVARAFKAADFALPPSEMLPELDRTFKNQELATARKEFWTRFSEQRDTIIRNAAVSESGSDYAETATAWLEFDLGPEASITDDYRGVDRIFRYVRIIANRIANAGGDPAQIWLRGEQVCDRINVLRSDRGKNITVATRLPFEFWDREKAQAIIDDLKACGADNSSQWIVDQFPDILKQGEERAAVLAEVQRWSTLPRSIETLRDTDMFTPSYDFLRSNGIERGEFEIIAGPEIAQLRAETLEAAGGELEKTVNAAVETGANANSYVSSYNICQDVLGYEQVLQERFGERCRMLAENAIQQRARVKAESAFDEFMAQVEGAETIVEARQLNWLQLPRGIDQNLVDPQKLIAAQATLGEARTRIAGLLVSQVKEYLDANPDEEINASDCPSGYGMPSEIAGAARECVALARAHNQKIADKRCNERLATLGAQDIGDDRIQLFAPLAGNVEMPVRDLLCREMPNADMRFSKGGWFSGGAMDVTLTYQGADITAQIQPSENDSDLWVVTDVKGYRAPEGISISACLIAPEICEKR